MSSVPRATVIVLGVPPNSVTLATPLISILKDYLGNVHILIGFKILLQLCL